MTINTGIDIRGGERSDTYNKPVRARTSFLSIEGLSKMRPTPATSDMSSRSLQSPGLRTPSFYKHENTNVVRKMHCHVPRRPVQKKINALKGVSQAQVASLCLSSLPLGSGGHLTLPTDRWPAHFPFPSLTGSLL